MVASISFSVMSVQITRFSTPNSLSLAWPTISRHNIGHCVLAFPDDEGEVRMVVLQLNVVILQESSTLSHPLPQSLRLL